LQPDRLEQALRREKGAFQPVAKRAVGKKNPATEEEKWAW